MENEDWSESVLTIKSLVKQIEELANMRQYASAEKILRVLEDELIVLKFTISQFRVLNK